MTEGAAKTSGGRSRLRVAVRGAVQGVGFRPFVYRLANQLGLPGWVNNSPQGVFIEVEGNDAALFSFLSRLNDERPPRSFIQSLESSYLDPIGFKDFQIRESEQDGARSAVVMPDISSCPDCLSEIFDPADRRFQYPFTNCTNCGPRYSIIESLPYDRPHTTMKNFVMCAECKTEYDDPNNRRFHAQPNACAKCGPHIELWDRQGLMLASRHEALLTATDAIRHGKIVAVKGIGGFHLMADARNEDAIEQLRKRKRREAKPFAVMFPSLHSIESECIVSDIERRLLTSPEAPIVLLGRRPARDLPYAIAPGNPYLGAMLPYTPLHHLLMGELGTPVIATSGNLSDEPICTDEHEALQRLNGIADLFLVHDRPIARHEDDSIVREIMGREMVVRRARGFAPLPILFRHEGNETLAVGAHLKNSVALSAGKQVFISQHIGDLETQPAFQAFEHVIESLEELYGARPKEVAFDDHPDYLSTRWAKNSHLRQIPVQHHYAHVLSCMTENEVEPPVIGIAWDGTGYGADGTVWGGEFLRITNEGYERFAHLRQFRLPGGDRAAREPRRSAIGLLYEIFGDLIFESTGFPAIATFSSAELKVIRGMLKTNLNAPVTSSAGRLFDAAAAIIGLREVTRFEGQAAMELEFAAQHPQHDRYKFEFKRRAGKPMILDWELMIRGIISDMTLHLSRSTISAKFHNTLVEMILGAAKLSGEKSIVLSGGCFQNKYLIEKSIDTLQRAGFKVYWHQRVPTNDGGICLGQAAAAAIEKRKEIEAERIESICV